MRDTTCLRCIQRIIARISYHRVTQALTIVTSDSEGHVSAGCSYPFSLIVVEAIILLLGIFGIGHLIITIVLIAIPSAIHLLRTDVIQTGIRTNPVDGQCTTANCLGDIEVIYPMTIRQTGYIISPHILPCRRSRRCICTTLNSKYRLLIRTDIHRYRIQFDIFITIVLTDKLRRMRVGLINTGVIVQQAVVAIYQRILYAYTNFTSIGTLHDKYIFTNRLGIQTATAFVRFKFPVGTIMRRHCAIITIVLISTTEQLIAILPVRIG